jgi:hypothetical protein
MEHSAGGGAIFKGGTKRWVTDKIRPIIGREGPKEE